MPKAVLNGQTVAQTDAENIIHIEGNSYFPPDSVDTKYFTPTDLHTTCHWKGEASYYDITLDGQTTHNVAWYYPQPKDGSIETVGKDFTDYIAFYPQVSIVE